MKYSPFDGSLDRVIEKLQEQNTLLQSKLDVAVQELARMDDRFGPTGAESGTPEDPFVTVALPFVIRVGYDSGELFYETQTAVFKMRESAALTVELQDDPEFEVVDSDTTVAVEFSPVQKSVYHTALDCDGNP